MSLPDGFLDELRTRLSLGQVVGRKVLWDQRKSNPGKGDLWAPCPFHQEKTASFHVDDRKGFYYCFGCHAKGDAISFVRETENVDFMEAVRILAGEAGLQMPERDPRAREKADTRSRLIDVMESAVQHFRLNLQTAAAGAARDYLAGRGLDAEACQRWDIGFAPAGWEGLRSALTGKGAAIEDLLTAGLVKPSDKGREPYDTFRDRIMFPIRDPRGRAIAFGGRAMDPNDNAKYLNSPETPLFDKSRTLYNHGPAREAAGKGQPLVVAEGYMDVIALGEAGFGATVAPLGTAVTEHHLAMLWRMAPEPIIALDGDTAGLRAALRVIDIALPLLEAGQSLRFALMPEGMDPDDVLRQKGRGAMQKILDGAIPMVELLWRRETDGKTFDSPERKAALDKALRDKIKLIRDPSIRSHYGQALNDMRRGLFRPQFQAQRSKTGSGPRGRRLDPWKAGGPVASNKASILGSGAAREDTLQEAVILAVCLGTPAVISFFEAQLEQLDCQEADHIRLRDSLLRNADQPDVRAAVAAEIGPAPLEKLFSQNHVAITPAVRRSGEIEIARLCLAEAFAKLTARRGHAREIAEAVEDLEGVADEGLTWRLGQAAAALDKAGRGDKEDRQQFEFGDNGAPMDKEERNALDELLSQINFAKGTGRAKS